MQARELVCGAAGEAEEVVCGGVGLGDEAAEGVVGAVVGDGGGAGGVVVFGQVADGAEVVGEGPEDVAFNRDVVDLLVGEDLVDGVAPEVAVAELGRALGVVVELEDDLADVVVGDGGTVGEDDVFGGAVVDEVGVVEAEGAGAVGVDGAGDPAVEVVVGVLDDLGGRAGGRVALGDAEEAVAVGPTRIRSPCRWRSRCT